MKGEGEHEPQSRKESSGVVLQWCVFKQEQPLPIPFQSDRQGMLRLCDLHNKKQKLGLFLYLYMSLTQ